MTDESATLQHIIRVQREYRAVAGRRQSTLVPQIGFRWPEVTTKADGRLSEARWSKTVVGWKQRSKQTNPTLWASPERWHEVERRFCEFQSDVKETSTAGNYIAHVRLQRMLRPKAAAASPAGGAGVAGSAASAAASSSSSNA